MSIALNKHTALSIVRALRADGRTSILTGKRHNLPEPSLGTRKKWTRSAFGFAELGLNFCTEKERQINLAVPRANMRVRLANSTCTVYDKGVPPQSFCCVGGGVHISCPELIFIEMASDMSTVEHLMLGYELCGTFARNAADPYSGGASFGVPPVTSTAKIAAYLEQVKGVRGLHAAKQTLKYLTDNAWSPTEALVAAFMRMPLDECGYGFGSLELNPRVVFDNKLEGAAKSSRVPDILVAGTKVGINYDGMLHLDLESIAKAAAEVSAHPESSRPQLVLDATMGSVRAKVVDDMRRNRELAAAGYTVFPMVKEDLYEPGGLDNVMHLVMDAVEQETGADLGQQRKALAKKTLAKDRHKLLLSLLPGRQSGNVDLGRYLGGMKLSEAPFEIIEVCIEL